MRNISEVGAACFLAVAAIAGAAVAQPAGSAVDWSQHADVEEVIVLTADEDGSARETTIWLVVVDGKGFIRTGNTTWGDNVVRNPEVAIRVAGSEIPVRVRFIEDEPLRERVAKAFRDKYGWFDAAIGVFRGSHPKIMQLDPRS
jgi:hypothetical protein